MKKIIIAGSEGLIGTELSNFLGNKGHNIVRCDLALGHDLNDETFTRSFFEKNKADCLINTFATYLLLYSKVLSNVLKCLKYNKGEYVLLFTIL